MDAPLDRSSVARLIDHTLLAPTATSDEVAALCAEAATLGVAAVCVSPSRLPVPTAGLDGVGIAAVVGFPSGAHTPQAKAREAADCVAAGATEIDMVVDLGAIAGGQWELAEAGVAAVRRAVEGRALLKVILESAVLVTLGDDVLERACAVSEAAGADFVKTSTGFHPAGGATTDAVARMRAAVGDRLGVKASGGIRDWATATAMVEAGATRLGCSATRAILDGAPA